MSRFLHNKYAALTAYTPGEQPQDKQYIKLNTNESPFPPTQAVVLAAGEAAARAHLYCDPDVRLLRRKAAEVSEVAVDNVLAFNGSDEVLYFIFAAFGQQGIAFPDISYGFYPVFAKANGVEAKVIPLTRDLRIDPDDYLDLGMCIVIANPNAPTGICLALDDIERIVASNRSHVVAVDEAYIDFGGDSALPLLKKFDNLLIIRTLSKSHSLAGARIGFGIGAKDIMDDLDLLRCCVNPYNVSAMGQAAALQALQENDLNLKRCRQIARIREHTAQTMKNMGFEVTPSLANFLFAKHSQVTGEALYAGLREKGILVRWFSTPRIRDHIRVTVGSHQQMEMFLSAARDILEDR